MTNQAAQTMPELPEPWTIRYHDDATGREIGPPTPLYTAAQMHQYARDYAAALAQPAGGADGGLEAFTNYFVKNYPGPNTIICDPKWHAPRIFRAAQRAIQAAAPAASGVDTSTNEAWAARAQEKIEAMDAASGGEACGCIYYGLGKAAPYLCEMHKARKADPHPPPAASVSERARDDRFTAMLIGIIADVQDALGFTDEDKECSNGSLEIVAAIRELKEQALTQQRGHGEAVDRDAWAEALELPEGYTVEEFLPGGWHYAWTRADGERMVSGTTWNHPALAAIAAWKYAPDTTPHPSADAVREYDRELIARMLSCYDGGGYTDQAVAEQIRLLREAENLEADARTVVRATEGQQQNAAQGGGVDRG